MGNRILKKCHNTQETQELILNILYRASWLVNRHNVLLFLCSNQFQIAMNACNSQQTTVIVDCYMHSLHVEAG